LTNLHLGCNKIPEEQINGIIAMDRFDVLCSIPIKELKEGSVIELDLAGCFLGREGAIVLSKYLKANSGNLTSLNVSHNCLSTKSIQRIASAITFGLGSKASQ
jgi:hypothetical protein